MGYTDSYLQVLQDKTFLFTSVKKREKNTQNSLLLLLPNLPATLVSFLTHGCFL